MFTRAVYARERLFVQQTSKIVSVCDFFHELHRKLVVVGSYVDYGEDGCKLVLGGRNLVVTGFSQNSQFPQLLVKVLHKSNDSGTNVAEVVVLKFLPFGRFRSEKSSSRKDEVFALKVKFFID